MNEKSTGFATVRVRFAPSPTGFLHIGGARTALFNWLYARSQKGQFLLRIEDTDRERSETRFTDDILESMRWLGFDYDEPPVFQSTRFEKYQSVANELLAKGLAFRCDCTTAELDAIREKCQKEKRAFRYPGTCREKKEVKSPHVIRTKVTSAGETKFTDLIRGEISFQNRDIDDWVIMRADGSPTYNFCVVIDDHDQQISHVLRGDDHINNTPKQILLYQALGYQVPNFAHLPMIMGADRAKLSKRHGAASTLEYRTMGYLPLALINFLVRLGWSHGDQEFFQIDELQRLFSLGHIGKANAIFNPDKLNWVSGHFMRDIPAAALRDYAKQYFGPELAFTNGVAPEVLEKGISIIQGKVKIIPEMIEQLHCLFGEDPKYDPSTLKPEDKAKYLEFLRVLEPVITASTFQKEDLESRVRTVAETLGQKLGPLAHALRFAVTGGKISPGLFEMLEIQGKATVTRRIGMALKALGS